MLILNGEGTVAHMCGPEGSTAGAELGGLGKATCDASDVFIAKIFTAGQVGATLGPFWLGTLIDRVGPRAGALLCSTMIVVGLAVVAIGMQEQGQAAEILLPIGFCIAGMFGSGIQFTAFHIANLFEDAHGTVTAIMSAAFGVSSLIFPVVHAVWEATGASGASVFWGLAIIDIVFVVYSSQLPTHSFELGDTVEFRGGKGFVRLSGDDEAHSSGSSTSEADSSLAKLSGATPVKIQTPVTTPFGEGICSEIRRSDGVRIVQFPWGTAFMQPSSVRPAPETPATETEGSTSRVRAMTVRHGQALREQLSSRDFLMISALLTFAFWRLNFYLASANVRLKLIGGIDAGNDFTAIFSWIAPFGALSAPFSGYLMDKTGLWAVLLLTTVLSTIHSVVVLIPVLELQIVAFVTYTLALETLFAWFFTTIGRVFGYAYFGTLSGVAFLVMGSAITPGPAVVDGLLASESPEPIAAFRIADTVLLCLSLPMMAYVVYLRRWERRNTTLASPESSSTALKSMEEPVDVVIR